MLGAVVLASILPLQWRRRGCATGLARGEIIVFCVQVDQHLQDAIETIMAHRINFHNKPRTVVGLCSGELSAFRGL